MNGKRNIAVIGAGLVGSLLSIYLARRGYKVSVFERRGDVRKMQADEGRSINLALSTRGIRALEQVGLAASIKSLAIPMHGRMMHDLAGSLSFLPYGKTGQYINSISRAGLNQMLIDTAEQQGVTFHFDHKCIAVNLENTSAVFETEHGKISAGPFDVMAGADGVFSSVRSAMQITDRFNYSQYYLEHGYKELEIPAGPNGEFVLEKNALHIWPRQSFMMIALPNPDGSFTCTLFLPFEGEVSFSSINGEEKISAFFKEVFPDVFAKMPTVVADYANNPTASLVTVRCFPWTRKQTFLIGDAAHGIVPFYGQGMNAAFEDCRILNELLAESGDEWKIALSRFESMRKADADAIAQLALDNFVEMRDSVADPEFLLRKKIEARLHELYPEKWTPLYAMVTFDENIRYSDAYGTGKKQAAIMDEVMSTPGIASRWDKLDFREIVGRLSN